MRIALNMHRNEADYFAQFAGDFNERWIVENYQDDEWPKFDNKDDAIQYIEKNLMKRYGTFAEIHTDSGFYWVSGYQIGMLLHPVTT